MSGDSFTQDAIDLIASAGSTPPAAIRAFGSVEPEISGTTHLVVTSNPSVRQFLSAFLQHLQRQFMASVKLDLLGNARLLPTGADLCPIFRKIKTCINVCSRGR